MSLSIAVTDRWKKDGEWQDRTEWIPITLFGKRADAHAKLLVKGARILVTGRFTTDKWKDKDGNTRSRSKVIANDVILLSERPKAAPTHAKLDETQDVLDDDEAPF